MLNLWLHRTISFRSSHLAGHGCGLHSVGAKPYHVVGVSERGKSFSGFLKKKIFEFLRNYQLFKPCLAL
jgi:hypothetical protein